MPTLDQLGEALRRADAAGNAEDARRLAQAYAQMRDAQGSQLPTATVRPPATPTQYDPTEGMSGYEKFMAGAGKSVVDTWRGLKQVGSAVADVVPGVDLSDYRNELQQEIDEAKRTDAPLMNTGWGRAGHLAGDVAQLYGPAPFLRATRAAGAFLPSTVIGNAAQGAALGALQPTATDESRGLNALAGGAGGALGAGALKIGGALYRGAAGMLGRGATDTADRAAADILSRESENMANLATPKPSSVPGVQRTLAEESLDPGIARLERNLRSTTNQFDSIDRANNAARVRAIEGFAGDDAALAAARSNRTQQTTPLLQQAYQDSGVDVGPVRAMLDQQIKATATRPSVQAAIRDVQKSLDQAGDDVFSLYGTRKYIGDLLSGKAGMDKSYARAATQQLMQVKNALDKQLADASPTFAQYLQRYRDLSEPVNRMQVGQRLLKPSSGSAILDPVTGTQVLTPAQFSKASRNLDEIAVKATGFKKAQAKAILQPGDIALIKAIQDDLERQAFRATAGSGGNSHTFERGALDERIKGRMGSAIAGRIPVVGRYAQDFLAVLDRTRNDRVKERLAYLVANPDEARRVIAALPPSGQKIVRKALGQIGGAIGRSAALEASAQSEPLQIDIVGGTPVPAEEFDRLVPPSP